MQSLKHHSARRGARQATTTEKKSAINLKIDPIEFLDALPSLSRANFAIRGRGISIFRSASLASFRIQRSEYIFEDLSGYLKLDSQKIREVVLRTDLSSPLHFEVDMIDTGWSLSVYPEHTNRDQEIVRHLASHGILHKPANDSPHLSEEWLDQELAQGSENWQTRLTIVPSERQIHVETEMESDGIAILTSFIASFVDRTGNTFRLAERDARTVVHYEASRERKEDNRSSSDPSTLNARLTCLITS